MMKKITLLLILIIASFGYAQVPGTAAPNPPARAAGDVISIYSDMYSNIAGVNIDPFWAQATDATEIMIGGNNTLSYTSFNYQGTDWAGTPQNISNMEFLHVDIWTNNEAPNVFVISSGPEIAHPISSSSGSWKSVEIPISGITGNTSSAIQFKFDGGTGGAIYLDNLYFYKSTTDPLKDATLSDLQVEGTTVNSFSPATENYTYELQVGTTTAPQITLATTSNVGASTVITQALSVPGNATVAVTSSDSSTMITYTISFVATLPSTSPTPSTPNAEVLSLYSDTGGFTTTWPLTNTYGSYAAKVDLGSGSSVNEAIKMDFSVEGYVEQGNKTDISGYGWIHFDYFAEADATEIRFELITTPGYIYELTTAGSDGTLVTGSWQSVDIPLSFFSAKGMDLSIFELYKLGTSSDLVSKIVYFDNIYFSLNKATTLSLKERAQTNFSVYPNPTVESWSIKAINTKIDSIRVFDVLGKSVLSISPNTVETIIDGSGLKSGLYFAQIKTQNGIESIKLIKR